MSQEIQSIVSQKRNSVDLSPIEEESMDVCENELKKIKIEEDLPTQLSTELIPLNTVDELEQRKPTLDEKINEVIKLQSRFYEIFYNDSRFDINKDVYIYWKKTSGTGKEFRKFIEHASVLQKLVQSLNERSQMSKAAKKLYVIDNLNDKQRILGFSTKKDQNFMDDKTFLEFKKESHRKRFKHIFYIFLKQYNFNILLNIKNVESLLFHYKNTLKDIEYNNLKEDSFDELLYKK